jgi:hypothetical protein
LPPAKGPIVGIGIAIEIGIEFRSLIYDCDPDSDPDSDFDFDFVRLAAPEASIIYKLLARRPRDLDDVDGIFAARSAAGEGLNWEFLETWAGEWGIAKELEPYRSRYGPGD